MFGEEVALKVYVKTPARLHLGLIDLNGSMGRMFGGLGVGVDKPNVVIEVEHAAAGLRVTGEEVQFVTELANRFFEKYQIKPNAHIHVSQAISAHTGLGSGTQTTLAVATALARLNCLNVSTSQLAFDMGRAKKTGVGTAVFEKGGFVVDGGKKIGNATGFPPLLFREAFPCEWRFVVAVPNTVKGLYSSEEVSAFNKLPPMLEGDVAKICRLTMFKLLPALIEKDIENFGEALTAIQILTGNYFAYVQGGTYVNNQVADMVEVIKNLGAYGAGQSSWGPAVYGVVKQTQAKEVLREIKKHLNKNSGGEAFIAKGQNKGTTIKVTKK
jgi:beta-RFAP synthase